MNKLLIIDGHNLLFKAFYGIPERLLSSGKPVQGVIGFVGIMTKIIREVRPTNVLVVFDPEEKSPKTNLYSQYKQNRQDFSNKPDRENPFSQLSDIKKALDNLGIKYLEQRGYEADDVIASFTIQYNCEIVIVSNDTDFLQLVNDRITVFRYHGKKSILFTEKVIQEKYGVSPSRFLEYKALIGDNTDNIDGIKGIGPKTAIKVLDNKKRLTKEERKIFERNKTLIKLNTEINLLYTLGQLSFNKDFKGFKGGEFLRIIGVL